MPSKSAIQRIKRKLRTFMETKGHCAYCGCKIELNFFGSQWNLDHVQPKSVPRELDSTNNSVASCVPCNSAKGNRSLKEFKDKFFKNQPFYLSDLNNFFKNIN